MRLKGKVALVTGGTRGLGRSIAEAYAAEGASVMVAGRGGDGHPSPVDGVADQVAFHAADVRDAASVDALMAATVARFGGLDIVVANAGVSIPGPVSALTPEQWTDVVTTNLTGVFHCVRSAVPYLEHGDGGRVITMSSVLGSRAVAGAAAYCATKAAVEAFTRSVALELAPRGITVNCLAPGFIDEGMGRALRQNEAVWERYRGKLALGRMGSADEVARAAVFLAAEDSSYVNGHVLEVNGGLAW
ncbi:SDR family NAD(P)-dependent oxidoreductase [Micromonospora sp. KC213]|uniref:SDR family NAD(P)-dependent oxidoreductase n=1 Tax=Micromonospora sp. KC213 TaxID=2530378 RepID=UPI0010527626|nr:SDR family NAD(P)-dependent oxidoreductase [Micromonospora sp. KC213]TDC42862.1 SDR family oxidoreductase [Micromonospora sp. KC213]